LAPITIPGGDISMHHRRRKNSAGEKDADANADDGNRSSNDEGSAVSPPRHASSPSSSPSSSPLPKRLKRRLLESAQRHTPHGDLDTRLAAADKKREVCLMRLFCGVFLRASRVTAPPYSHTRARDTPPRAPNIFTRHQHPSPHPSPPGSGRNGIARYTDMSGDSM